MVPVSPLPLSTSNPAPSPNIDGNGYQDALDRLQPLQPILRGFNHRNRNQHRRAAWWAPFGMLRRHVERTVDELLEAADAVTAAAAKSKSKKRRRRRDDDDDDGGGGGDAESKVRGHVEWLRDVLVPKCYLAFSQLTADNQFATLGVVLLSALAQVNAACVHLVGEAAEVSRDETSISTADEPPDSSAAVVRLKEPSGPGAKEPSSRPVLADMSSERGGSVISRAEVARADKLRRKTVQVGSSDIPSNAKRCQDHGDDVGAVKKQQDISSKAKTKESVKLAKKKKTKKGGDEFDDLFKSLF
ncbi:hypothetical protein F4813DRAFT_345542 [Daldinia decipiens]|uniref:uncharacterized protein n=1 Tax=Daldinia decipiens TaxID=326647 RepID=UPI0020C25EA4|nr:uncharacterized protein F4813DRAFT_345542 [Daldinia decipiens]KAI1661721.1 hypothetical protein F4813DRAFT_345542 [Daldinia decipiens]